MSLWMCIDNSHLYSKLVRTIVRIIVRVTVVANKLVLMKILGQTLSESEGGGQICLMTWQGHSQHLRKRGSKMECAQSTRKFLECHTHFCYHLRMNHTHFAKTLTLALARLTYGKKYPSTVLDEHPK